MQPSLEFRYDVASALSQGQRDYQEDAIITDFPFGSEVGFAVLADGMGGHAAGDMASKIVLTEVFSELKLQSGDKAGFVENLSDILREAAMAANECVKGHVKSYPDTRGMGATLVAPVFVGDQLSWVSIGDSPLFLYRDGELSQLNEDHSMAPQIDLMVAAGMLDAEAGRTHPDRNSLTSVLIGDKIARVDCPKKPIQLQNHDLLIVASDGLQFLSNEQIAQILGDCGDLSSQQISEMLMKALEDLGDPDQDNISFSVIKITQSDRVDLARAVNGQSASGLQSGRLQSDAPVGGHSVLRPKNMFRDYTDICDTGT